jgi:hypothetical protein
MMVCRKNTGWEHLKDSPVRFFEEILQLQLTEMHKAWIDAIGDDRRDRIGLVWDPNSVGVADEATIAVGLALWAASCRHRPTLLWGGRRSVANAWLDHAVVILTNAKPEFRHGYRLVRDDSDKPMGIQMPNGAWTLRFDGALASDPIEAAEALGNKANVLIGDFSWVDRDSLEDALDYAEEHAALVTIVVGHGRT